MQIVFDYLSGKVSSDEFKSAWYANPQIGLWLENLIDLRSELNPEWSSAPYPHFRIVIHKHYNGSVLEFIKTSDEFHGKYNYPKWLDIGWRFEVIASIVSVAYPGAEITTHYDEEREFYIATTGDYIGGTEVEAVIFDVMQQFPRSIGKTKRKKEAKAAIRLLFHIEKNQYPRWIQEPDWPMGEHSPMRFLKQTRHGEIVQFYFSDVDTGKIRIIEQLH